MSGPLALETAVEIPQEIAAWFDAPGTQAEFTWATLEDFNAVETPSVDPELGKLYAAAFDLSAAANFSLLDSKMSSLACACANHFTSSTTSLNLSGSAENSVTVFSASNIWGGEKDNDDDENDPFHFLFCSHQH